MTRIQETGDKMMKNRNTKYRFVLPSFAALLYRLLRHSHQRSGRRLGFFLNHGGTKAQRSTETELHTTKPLRPSLRGTKQSVLCTKSKPAITECLQKITNQKSAISNHHSSSVFHNLILFSASLLLFSSCEKVIDIKLDEADKQVVIEGTVSYNTNTFPEVRISQTKDFEDDNNFNGISGATVAIQINNGGTFTLPEIEKGIYTTTQFTGALDSTYTLTVQLNGNTYTSVSHLPAQAVTLDSLWAEGLVFGGSTNITIYPQYDDPKGLGNNYRLVQYANDTLVRKAFPQNDEFSDGNTVTRPLINPDSKLKEGDSITVELQCIDANIYKYWYSLDVASTGNNQSATPTNPVTNISGGALGYFSAYSASRYSIRIPK